MSAEAVRGGTDLIWLPQKDFCCRRKRMGRRQEVGSLEGIHHLTVAEVAKTLVRAVGGGRGRCLKRRTGTAASLDIR